ncbi:MAG: L-threonylcarbamoyladenylate synthase [candidate division KSB1 bacterium]|nr:L-threonylcarbamoyladenylate synthase [candidate division KSB1 bacterium]
MGCPIIKINQKTPEHGKIERAAQVLINGGVIGYPTETVYGLGCNAYNSHAVERIYKLKQRDRRKALILIAGDIMQISDMVETIPESAERLINNFWPGPLTLIFESSSRIREFAFGRSKTVAIRIPDSLICQELIKETGFPLVSTSANRSGEPAATTAQQVKKVFQSEIDLIIDGGKTFETTPSTLVDITKTPARIVREGAISSLEINTVLETV